MIKVHPAAPILLWALAAAACSGPSEAPAPSAAPPATPPGAATEASDAEGGEAAPTPAKAVLRGTLRPESAPSAAPARAEPAPLRHPEAARLRERLRARHPEDLPSRAELTALEDPAGALAELAAAAEPLVAARALEMLGWFPSPATSELLVARIEGQGVAEALRPRMAAAAARGVARLAEAEPLAPQQLHVLTEALRGADPRLTEALSSALAQRPEGVAALRASLQDPSIDLAPAARAAAEAALAAPSPAR